jgi:hypothetical protein
MRVTDNPLPTRGERRYYLVHAEASDAAQIRRNNSMDLEARIVVIAALAPVGGFGFYLMAESLASRSELSALLTLTGILISFLVWLTSAGAALVAGLLLHTAIRNRKLPSIAILFLFSSVAAAICWPISQGPGLNPFLLVLGVGTAVTCWALYCHSPLRVWNRPVVAGF